MKKKEAAKSDKSKSNKPVQSDEEMADEIPLVDVKNKILEEVVE